MPGYRPKDRALWDTWYIEHEDVVHMFYLQRFLSDRDKEESALGHAVSTDLVHWEQLDDMSPWTGCVFEHAGRFYLYYTMRSRAGRAKVQRIGVATSKDLEHWERYQGNPIITPDPSIYVGVENPGPTGVVDCRDLTVVAAPDGGGWYGVYAGRVPSDEHAEGEAVAVVRSDDLLHWEHLPPAFAPRKYGVVEVPEIFPLDGRWYLLVLTGNVYGNRGIFSDANVIRGTAYAVGERPEGPYREVAGDNTLQGGDDLSGFASRTLLHDGKRIMFNTQRTSDLKDLLSPPYELRASPGGRLRAHYSDYQHAWRTGRLIDPTSPPPIAGLPGTTHFWVTTNGRWDLAEGGYRGDARTGWQTADLGVGARSMEIEARVTLHAGVAAGLTIRPDSAQEHVYGDLVFALNADEGVVEADELNHFPHGHRRLFNMERGRGYHLRLSARPPRYELYVDDVFVLECAFDVDSFPAPTVGLFVDRGECTVTDVSAWQLED